MMKKFTLFSFTFILFIITLGGIYVYLYPSSGDIPLSDKRPFISMRNIEDSTDFFVSTREHFKKYIKKHHEKISALNPQTTKPLDFYIKNFHIIKGSIDEKKKDFREGVKEFKKHFSKVSLKTLFDFHYNHVNKEETIVVIKDPNTIPSYFFSLMVDLEKKAPNKNIVFIDSSAAVRTHNTLSSKYINNTFTDDFRSFLKETSLNETHLTLNVICMAYTHSLDLLKNHHELYNNTILYTPYAKMEISDQIIPPQEIINPKRVMINYKESAYLYPLAVGRAPYQEIYPKAVSQLNIRSQINLVNRTKTGDSTVKGIKNRHLIYPQYERFFNLSSFEPELFDKQDITVMKGLHHNDFLFWPEATNRYTDKVIQIHNSAMGGN